MRQSAKQRSTCKLLTPAVLQDLGMALGRCRYPVARLVGSYATQSRRRLDDG
jgi:hypothetical protein